MISNPKFLHILSLIEGLSFLMLLTIAMPLKYIWGMPIYVKVIGMIHGILFIALFVLIYFHWKSQKLKALQLIAAWITTTVPFGWLYLDDALEKN